MTAATVATCEPSAPRRSGRVTKPRKYDYGFADTDFSDDDERANDDYNDDADFGSDDDDVQPVDDEDDEEYRAPKAGRGRTSPNDNGGLSNKAERQWRTKENQQRLAANDPKIREFVQKYMHEQRLNTEKNQAIMKAEMLFRASVPRVENVPHLAAHRTRALRKVR